MIKEYKTEIVIYIVLPNMKDQNKYSKKQEVSTLKLY